MHIHIFRKERKVTIKSKVKFVNKFRGKHKLKLLCKATKLSKSSYFEYLYRKKSKREAKKEQILPKILKIWKDSNKIYGARKICSILGENNVKISSRTVSKYMQILGIRSIYRLQYRPKSIKNSSNAKCSNLIKNIKYQYPNQVVVTDITYIHTIKNGWVYQITFMDAYSRKILLSKVGNTMDNSFVISSTKRLISLHQNIQIIHSDRGSQYTSYDYRSLLKKNNILVSYSAKGYPYDNALIESYHASIKRECLYRNKIMDLENARKLVFQYNYGFYNTRRIHQSLNYKTPNSFLRNYTK